MLWLLRDGRRGCGDFDEGKRTMELEVLSKQMKP